MISGEQVCSHPSKFSIMWAEKKNQSMSDEAKGNPLPQERDLNHAVVGDSTVLQYVLFLHIFVFAGGMSHLPVHHGTLVPQRSSHGSLVNSIH